MFDIRPAFYLASDLNYKNVDERSRLRLRYHRKKLQYTFSIRKNIRHIIPTFNLKNNQVEHWTTSRL